MKLIIKLKNLLVNIMIIDKDAFLKWQDKIIDEYYTDKHLKTELIPKKNKPSVLKQSKAILVLDFDKLSTDIYIKIKEKNWQKNIKSVYFTWEK